MNLPPTYKDRLETLFKDIVMRVVYFYFEAKVLAACNTSSDFNGFLQKNKHDLFHRFKPCLPCCECIPSKPLTGPKNQYLDKHQFEILYPNTNEIQQGHEIQNKMHVTQTCLCKYEQNVSTEIIDLDITLIIKLIKICSNVTLPGNPKWLETIKIVRNKLSHWGAEERLEQRTYKEMKGQLENAALDLAGTLGRYYKWDIDKRIKTFNQRNQQIDEIVTTLSDMTNANMEKNVCKVLNQLDIKLDKLVLKINGPTFNSSTSATNENENILKQELLEEYKSTGQQKCIVFWKLKSKDMDFKDIEEKLHHVSAILDFKILFEREECLILKTITSFLPLFNTNLFVNSVKCFIKELVDICCIDVSKKNIITIEIGIHYIPDEGREDYQKACSGCRKKDSISQLGKRSKGQLKRSQSCDSFSVEATQMIDSDHKSLHSESLGAFGYDDSVKETGKTDGASAIAQVALGKSELLNDRTRFSKLVEIVNKVCTKWMEDLTRTRIPPTLSILEYIRQRRHEKCMKDRIIQSALARKQKNDLMNDDFDWLTLTRLIKIGKLLLGHPVEHIIKDSINKLGQLRNDIINTTGAKIDKVEYNDLIEELKKIAIQFEMYNNKQEGEYVQQINDFH